METKANGRCRCKVTQWIFFIHAHRRLIKYSPRASPAPNGRKSKTLTTISDSRSCLTDIPALQSAVEAAMGHSLALPVREGIPSGASKDTRPSGKSVGYYSGFEWSIVVYRTSRFYKLL
jgi:hypothetical protein